MADAKPLTSSIRRYSIMQPKKRAKSWQEAPGGSTQNQAPPPKFDDQHLHGENGEALIYEEVDLTNPFGEDQEQLPPFPLDALPERFRLPIMEVMRHYKVDALLPA